MTTYKDNKNGSYALYTNGVHDEVTNSNEWKESASVTNRDLLNGTRYQAWFNHELDCITYSHLPVDKPQWTDDDNTIVSGIAKHQPIHTCPNCFGVSLDSPENRKKCPQCNYSEFEELEPSKQTEEHTGLSVGYYDVVIPANSHTNPEHNQPNDVCS